jgi:hypothetical protein
MANPPFRLVTHPGPVATDILGEPSSRFPRAAAADPSPRIWMYRAHVHELGRKLNQRLGDQHCDWIEVRGIR